MREGRGSDAGACGRICYEAFKAIATAHNFPPDFPDPETAIGLMHHVLNEKTVYSVVAEVGETIVGSNFMWLHTHLAGIGPITVNPALQNTGTGRQLMENVLKKADELGMAGVRLVQAAYHNRSLALYTKLGFTVVAPLSVIQGPALGIQIPGYRVRNTTLVDLAECNALCHGIHGHDRRQELHSAIATGTAMVVEHSGVITGYTTQLGFFGHTVARTNTALMALIGAADGIAGPGFLLPAGNAEVFKWCLTHGLRVIQPMSLMSRGLYKEPAGAFLPSVIY